MYLEMLQDVPGSKSYVASRPTVLPRASWTWRWSARPLITMGTRRQNQRRPNQNDPSSTNDISTSATNSPLLEGSTYIRTQDVCRPLCNVGAEHSDHGVNVPLGGLKPRNARCTDTPRSWRKSVSTGVMKVVALSFMWPLVRAADITTNYFKPTVSSKVRHWC